ncbi:MAG: hypothetical protein HN396_18950, partial [Gemmatimonadales bacterium]|nr:hypothetical protein [Gemmatimonadales bacterium]
RHATREALLDAYVAPLAVRGTEASFWESFGEYGALTLRAEAYMPHTASRPLPYLWVTQDDDDFGVGEWRWTYELPVGTVLRAQLLGRPEPTSRHIERIRAAVGTDDWEGVTAEVIQSTSHIVGEYALQQAVAQHEWREAQLIAGAIELITRRTDDAAESTLDFLNWP